jgi:phosphoesterase RecJ-like protein
MQNNKFKKVLELIENSHYILIVTHINPDADTISSALALSNFMFEKKIKHKVFTSSEQLPRVLDFLPRFSKITNQIPKFYDLVIYVDCADQKRVGIEICKDTKIINIDHHKSNTNFGDINIVNSQKGSAAEVVFSFFEENNLKISKNIATCLYVGIYDDNIAFTTPRTSANTFKTINILVNTGIEPNKIASNLLQRDSLAKYRIIPKILDTLQLNFEGEVATIYLELDWLKETGASIEECDSVVNMVLNIGIVNVVAYFRVCNGAIRVSLRSKNDVDVSKLAKLFNGGGHKNAAGLTILDTKCIKEAKEKLMQCIKHSLKKQYHCKTTFSLI